MPATPPQQHEIMVNGVRLCYFERGVASPDRPTLVFIHATGFHGRVWDRLAEAFPEHHSLALELRGHGRSENVPIDHWRDVAIDICEFVTALGVTNAIGIGHSMGAHCLVDAAAHCDAFASLLLLDPTIAAPESYADDTSPFPDGAHPATRRRNHFDSPEEMIERLLPKSSFALYEPRILDDYCRYGLVPAPEGGFQLACPPEMEATVYMSARSNGGVYDSIRKLDIPVFIVRAKERSAELGGPDFSSSPTWPGLVNEFKNAQELHLQDCSHFIPMQKPDLVIGLIREQVDQWEPAS